MRLSIVIAFVLFTFVCANSKKPLMGADEFRIQRTECKTDRHGRKSVACPRTFETVCVKYVDLCNGVKDCPDGSDEDEVYCVLHRARAFEIMDLASQVNTLKGK